MKNALTVLVLSALIFSPPIVSAAVKVTRIALIGDSTVTDRSGWGQAFAGRFDRGVHVLNFAVGGRSSKSWYDENRLPNVLDANPDYVLIQFGHNGQPGKGPARETDPATTYRDYLRLYVQEFSKIGAKPIIVSSVTRRRFNKNNRIVSSLTAWAEAAKAVAHELDVPFVDLHTASIHYHNKIGPDASMAFNPKTGDLTHYNRIGAEAIADLIVEALKVVAKDLCVHLKEPVKEANCTPETIELEKNWRFSPDVNNIGKSENWYSPSFDDSQWAELNAGKRWEDLGYRDLDSFAWYRKTVDIPAHWKGKDIWLKFEGVNDAYALFVNGKSVSYFGEANISVASRPTFTEISHQLIYGARNLIAVRVNDWGNSGGLWRLPVILTTDESKVSNIFKPISDTRYTPEGLGYTLFWEDQFDGNRLDPKKWAVRGVGPRAIGYISADAVNVKDGYLELGAFEEDGAIKVGAVGTHGRFTTKYGYFECRAQLQKSKGNWAAFWIQSAEIAQGEDPAKFGTEIDIMEYFKKQGEDMISHNLHWAYGPNQKSIGGLLSRVDGVSEGFHTFALEWTPDKYAFYVDGYKYYEVTEAISHIDEYLILSMELPSRADALKEAVFPDAFIVDYVKVYK